MIYLKELLFDNKIKINYVGSCVGFSLQKRLENNNSFTKNELLKIKDFLVLKGLISSDFNRFNLLADVRKSRRRD